MSDNGAQFVSSLMNEVARLLSINFIHATPYHPQANGLVERMNGTLKTMLRRMCAEKPLDWDRYVESLLFAYREAPQRSLLFSPFELLYGRRVRGPMTILRELWSNKYVSPELENVYSYVFELRNRLEKTCSIARDNLSVSQAASKRHFDRRAKLRKLQPNDLTLVLLPTNENKLLMHWKGPFEVIGPVLMHWKGPFEVIGPVGINDYRIQIGENIKVFHINMLRKYRERIPTDAIAAISMVENVSDDDLDSDPELSASNESWIDAKINPELSSQQKSEISALLLQLSDIFSDKPGSNDWIEHSIDLNTDIPIRVRQYPIPHAKVGTFENEVRKILNQGIIESSCSPYRSPMLLVKKSDGAYRPVIDYRSINKVTKFDGETIPNPEYIFAKLGSARYLTKLDFTKGYWQIPIKKSDREITAFSTSLGHMQFKYMPFGLVNSGATYSRMTRLLLKDLAHVDNYIDVLVHNSSWKEHLRSLASLFIRISRAGLTVKPSKCCIAYDALSFVGHAIKQGKLQTKQEIIDKVANATVPCTTKKIRSFLGLSGFYRRFIPHYAEIAAPLVELTKKNKPLVVIWNQGAERAFHTLKRLLCTAPILHIPDMEKPFILRTDASDVALGAVLLQSQNDTLFPIAYASKSLSSAQKAYSVIERECLAILWSLDKFYAYLYGKKFTIQTDHQPLAYLKTAKISNTRLMRWAIKLQPFNLSIEAITGTNNVGADYLSRS